MIILAIFGLHDIDPLFEGLSQQSQETVLSLAHGQAGSFISTIQSAAEASVQEEAPTQPPRVVPHDQEQLSESDFNYVLAEAHPALLKSVFVMGFTQGFCLRHRLQWLDTEMYTLMPPIDEEDSTDTADEEGSADDSATDNSQQ